MKNLHLGYLTIIFEDVAVEVLAKWCNSYDNLLWVSCRFYKFWNLNDDVIPDLTENIQYFFFKSSSQSWIRVTTMEQLSLSEL